MHSIGTIQSLYRYPVKSMRGEQITSTQVEPYGFYGDRSHAFIDPSKTGWSRFITARKYPQLLSYRAALLQDGSETAFPSLSITHDQGESYTWDERFLQHMREQIREDITMEQHSPASSTLLAVDASSILIVTEASIRQMERLWGKPLDLLRFRPNIVVQTSDSTPFVETDWIGQQLQIGEGEDAVLLQIDESCERCVLITIDPDTYQRDPSLLKTLHQERQAFFGVYASIVKTGRIRQDDILRLHTTDHSPLK